VPRLSLLALLLLSACVAPPTLHNPDEPEPTPEPTPEPRSFDELMADPRIEGQTRGTLTVDMPWLGQTQFDAIYVEPGTTCGQGFHEFLAGDGISCEAWQQWEATCRQAQEEGIDDAIHWGWNRFWGDPPWILASYEDADGWLADTRDLPLATSFYFEIDQSHSWIETPDGPRQDIYSEWGAEIGVLQSFEEDEDGLQVEFDTGLSGLYVQFIDGEWVPFEDDEQPTGLTRVRWIDVPRCETGTVL